MTKDILAQYCDLQQEIKDLRERIERLERQIENIEDEGCVSDSVTCGKKGKKPLGTVKITGFPNAEYSRKKTRLYLNKAQLESVELELLEITSDVEEYIQSIEDSRIRKILRLRYIDGMTWIKVAQNMRGQATADSVRMEHNRFLGI